MATTIQVFPERLRQARRDAALTQAELAKRAGVTQSAISGFELGHARPNLITVTAIAKALNVSVAQLLEEAEVSS